MAKMIDEKPSFKGEGKVWDKLNEYLPSDMVVYNQREINGREYDFCVMAENLGIVVIEVKEWLAEKIIVNGVDNIDVEGYERPQTSPKKQARVYRFAILNKISEKYNVSPLVLDMVCYPFISKAEYESSRLDIISEEQYTIFKEDLEDRERLNNKIINVFQVNSVIPHSDFSYDLMFRIRRSLEPDIKENVEDGKVLPYSKLYIIPDMPNITEVEEMIDIYFMGVKSIIFVEDGACYKNIIRCLNDGLRKRNVDYKKNNLYLGYYKGISEEKDDDCFRIFNFELYHIDSLGAKCSEKIVVKEGKVTPQAYDVLRTLSECSAFNLQQYEVEHASTLHDILVEAGAGTGKTFSMVSRIAYLCNKEVDAVSNIADEIAMVTFTNDAAINMKKRLKQMFVNYFVLTGREKYLKFVEDIDRSNISTIHKFAIGILRGESLYTGLGTNFRITENEHKRGKTYDLFLGEFLEEKECENANFVNELPIPIYDLKKKLMSIADRLFDKSINLEQIKTSEMGVTVDNNIPYFNELLTRVVFPAEVYFPEQFGERQFLNYPLGHFFIAIANMWDSETNGIIISDINDIRECLGAGILAEATTGRLVSTFGKLEALFDGCASIDDMLSRIKKVRKNKKYVSDEKRQEYLGHISYYSVSSIELKELEEALNELEELASFFYEDFEKRPSNFRRFYKKLKQYLQEEILEERELSEEFSESLVH